MFPPELGLLFSYPFSLSLSAHTHASPTSTWWNVFPRFIIRSRGGHNVDLAANRLEDYLKLLYPRFKLRLLHCATVPKVKSDPGITVVLNPLLSSGRQILSRSLLL